MAMGILHTIDTILTVVEDHKEVRVSFVLASFQLWQQALLCVLPHLDECAFTTNGSNGTKPSRIDLKPSLLLWFINCLAFNFKGIYVPKVKLLALTW